MTRNYTNIDTIIGGDSDNSSGTMSKVQGGMKCVKYLLFVFNFIFWVSRHSYHRWRFSFFYSCSILKRGVSASFAIFISHGAHILRWSQRVTILYGNPDSALLFSTVYMLLSAKSARLLHLIILLKTCFRFRLLNLKLFLSPLSKV